MILNATQKKFIDKKLKLLAMSKFRNSFKLKTNEINYVKEKGLDLIEEHAFGFIKNRLGSSNILNDGRQTPMKGHPVFVAQHATATCCRGCLYKWHKIEKNRELTDREINFIVALIIEWIIRNSMS